MNFKLKAIAAGVLLAMAGGANAAISPGATSGGLGSGEIFLNATDGTNSFAFDTGITANAFLAMTTAARSALSFDFSGDANWSSFNSNSSLVWNLYASNTIVGTSALSQWGLLSTMQGGLTSGLTNTVSGIAAMASKMDSQSNAINNVTGDANYAANVSTYIPSGNAASYSVFGSNNQNQTGTSNQFNVNDWASFIWLGRNQTNSFGAKSVGLDLGVAHLDTTGHLTFAAAAPSAVPVPAAVWLLGSALLGLVGVGSRKNRELSGLAA